MRKQKNTKRRHPKNKRSKNQGKLTRLEKADLKLLSVAKNSRYIIQRPHIHGVVLAASLAASLILNVVQLVWG